MHNSPYGFYSTCYCTDLIRVSYLTPRCTALLNVYNTLMKGEKGLGRGIHNSPTMSVYKLGAATTSRLIATSTASSF